MIGHPRPSRRGLLGALALAPMAAGAAITSPAAIGSASDIERQYRVWQHAYQIIDGGSDEDTNRAEWDAIDGAEIAIRASQETGARAAEIKLWVALMHIHDSRIDSRAVVAGDIDALRADKGLDWETKMVVSAIASLRSGGLNS